MMSNKSGGCFSVKVHEYLLHTFAVVFVMLFVVVDDVVVIIIVVYYCYYSFVLSLIFLLNYLYIGTWEYVYKWSVCSATCDVGTQTRRQSCVYSDNTAAEEQCSGDAGSESRKCNIGPCSKLFFSWCNLSVV